MCCYRGVQLLLDDTDFVTGRVTVERQRKAIDRGYTMQSGTMTFERFQEMYALVDGHWQRR